MPSETFNKQFGRHVLVDASGALRLTAAGRAELGPKLTRLGFDLERIRTLESFVNAMTAVNDLEYEENTEAMRTLAAQPDLSDVERDVLARMLGDSMPARPALTRPQLQLV